MTILTDGVIKFLMRAMEAANSTDAKVIIPWLVRGDIWKDLRSDAGEDANRLFVTEGAGHPLKKLLKGSRAPSEGKAGGDGEQLTMVHLLSSWPERFRDSVLKANRFHVFVPSLERYVRLDPSCISRAQVIEAGEYVEQKGYQSVRRGEAIKAIAAIGIWPDPGQEQAA